MESSERLLFSQNERPPQLTSFCFVHMQSTRATLEEALRKLSVEPTTKMVITTAECCLRPVGDSHAKRFVHFDILTSNLVIGFNTSRNYMLSSSHTSQILLEVSIFLSKPNLADFTAHHSRGLVADLNVELTRRQDQSGSLNSNKLSFCLRSSNFIVAYREPPHPK